jgi:hypothetical protein
VIPRWPRRSKIALKRAGDYQRRYRALVDATDVLIVGLDGPAG